LALPTDPKQTWPPAAHKTAYTDYALRAAWYGGDMEALANLYAAHLSNPFDRRSAFWAEQSRGERRTLLHIPMAGDIAAVSANLLFGEHPVITCEDAAAQDRLDAIIEDSQAVNTLVEAADAASGMGGVFLKVNWDAELAPYPILSIAQADAALPEFRHGILTACTFWRVLQDDGQTVWRVLERHEDGSIETALYRGSPDSIGGRVALTERAETADIAPFVRTGIDGLLCRYVPNMRPNRRRRGSDLGRADTDGCESLMDSLDEVYTSWLRDIRLGRGRVIVPEEFLQFDATTGTPFFDSNREAFVALSAPIGSGEAAQQISVQQFAVRAAEHLATAQELVTRIVTAAGYSPQTFGLNIQGTAESGTALRMRESRSYQTTAAKAQYWRDPLADLFEILLQVDRLHLGGTVTPERPNVSMQDGVVQGAQELAQTVVLLQQAQAASVDTRVRMVHPDWSEEQVAAEVQRINDEQGLTLPNPYELGEA